MVTTVTDVEALPLPSWHKRQIHLGTEGPDVRVVMRKLGLDPDGPFSEVAAFRVKGVARSAGIPDHDGVVDELTARLLGEAATAEAGMMPEWFSLRLGDSGTVVDRAAKILDVDAGGVFTEEMEAAVRRHQSASRLDPTGVIDVETARSLGEL